MSAKETGKSMTLHDILETLKISDASMQEMEEEIREEIWNQLAHLHKEQIVEEHIKDMIETAGLNCYGQGMKVGIHIAKILDF